MTFRNCYRVRYCLMADGVLFDYKTGEVAVVLFRRQHFRRIRPNHDLLVKESYHAVRDLAA
jgi:hypothetical protein